MKAWLSRQGAQASPMQGTLAPSGASLPSGALPRATTTLRMLLGRAYVGLAVAAVGLMGLLLAVPMVVTLHFYAEHDLLLLGRAIGNTVEAAVVFDDAEAAQEALAAIVQREDVAEATVVSRGGRVLARWDDESGGWRARVGAAAGRLLQSRPAEVPIVHDGAVLGRVEVRSGGRTLLRFLTIAVLGSLAGQTLIVLVALFLSRRILRQIVRPLQTLAQVAGTVQRERAFGQRVPETGVAELNELGHAFNALLGELDQWQGVMEGENRRLSHQASHDGLTGLANRGFFEGRLARAVTDARQAGTRVAVMLIDCDKFKGINDAHGHAAGDAVLVGIAARLRGNFRERDLVARLGGDEFAVLIAPAHDLADVRRLAGTAARAMQAPLQVREGLNLVCGLSVGLAIFPDDAASAEELLHRADESMYRVKAGHGREW